MALKVQMLQVLSYRVRRDFADVIKELEMEEWVYIIPGSPNCNQACLREGDRGSIDYTGGKGYDDKQQLEYCGHKPRSARNLRNWKR